MRLFALSDDPILYVLTGQFPVWQTNLYNASPWYEQQRDRFKPFNRLVEPDLAMRDEVVQLTATALRRGRKVYVLVNNKAEGSSPLTVEALAARLADVLAADPPPTGTRRTSG